MYFPFCLDRVSTQPSEIETEYLSTLVVTPGQGAGKHGISKDSVVQTTILEHAVIGAELVHLGWICNVPTPCWVVRWTVLLALCRGIPQHQASILKSMASFHYNVVRQAVCTAFVMSTLM